MSDPKDPPPEETPEESPEESLPDSGEDASHDLPATQKPATQKDAAEADTQADSAKPEPAEPQNEQDKKENTRDEDNVEASRAPLVSHLAELRQRLIKSLIALLVGFIVSFFFAQPIYDFLAAPLTTAWEGETGRRMIFTALHEQFFTQVKVAFFSALFLGFPILSAQIWMFVAPGLYNNERRAFLPFLIATPALFFLGGAFVYYIVMPVAIEFFLGFEQLGSIDGPRIELEAKVSEYLSLIMQLIFAFGLCFELPVLLTLLVRVGIASSDGLKAKRKYAILLAFVAAAILTPPDPLSQIGLALPIILLYEISIWAGQLIEKTRAKDAY